MVTDTQKISGELAGKINGYIQARAHEYTYRNYTDLAISCQVWLIQNHGVARDDMAVFDYVDNAASEAVYWPDDSTLGSEDY